MLTTMVVPFSQSGQAGREIVSLGAHNDEVDANMSIASHDQLFTPLMVDAGLTRYHTTSVCSRALRSASGLNDFVVAGRHITWY